MGAAFLHTLVRFRGRIVSWGLSLAALGLVVVPFYDVYETSDGLHMAVGALEPQFFAALVDLLGVSDTCPGQ